jgi:hypothetical protein
VVKPLLGRLEFGNLKEKNIVDQSGKLGEGGFIDGR